MYRVAPDLVKAASARRRSPRRCARIFPKQLAPASFQLTKSPPIYEFPSKPLELICKRHSVAQQHSHFIRDCVNQTAFVSRAASTTKCNALGELVSVPDGIGACEDAPKESRASLSRPNAARLQGRNSARRGDRGRYRNCTPTCRPLFSAHLCESVVHAPSHFSFP
jgi:hypothetical protein